MVSTNELVMINASQLCSVIDYHNNKLHSRVSVYTCFNGNFYRFI